MVQVYLVIYNKLNCYKEHTKRVLRLLTDNREKSDFARVQKLKNYLIKQDEFLARIVICYVACIHWYEPDLSTDMNKYLKPTPNARQQILYWWHKKISTMMGCRLLCPLLKIENLKWIICVRTTHAFLFIYWMILVKYIKNKLNINYFLSVLLTNFKLGNKFTKTIVTKEQWGKI